MTNSFIWNYKLPSEKNSSVEEYEYLINSINDKINQDDGKYIYVHKVIFRPKFHCTIS